MQAIYAIIHRETGRYYVGSTVNIYRRRKEHRFRLRRGEHPAKHLNRAFDKYGEDAFYMRVLEMPVLGGLHEREQVWIDRIKPIFNVAPVAGSVRGITRSPEVRARMSAAQLMRFAENPCKLKGRPRDLPARLAISAGKKGKPLAPEHRAKVTASRIRNETLKKEIKVLAFRLERMQNLLK